jgi:DNA-binding IclR family transcriptional regulator
MSDWPPRSLDGLLDGAVDSVGSIELLLLLRAAGEQGHAVDHLSGVLGSPRTWTKTQLDVLARAGLAEPAAAGRWRYAPASATLAGAVDDLADAWQRDRRTVRRWVFKSRRRTRRTGGA